MHVFLWSEFLNPKKPNENVFGYSVLIVHENEQPETAAPFHLPAQPPIFGAIGLPVSPPDGPVYPTAIRRGTI